MKYDDLVFGLREHAFVLTKSQGTYEVKPLMKNEPVYEFQTLGEVQAFHSGIEAQKQWGNKTPELSK
ncbi:hypothetical protein [Vibrio sp. D431a]|uniref:hypothetical protein n=1 Tax=Vibrio sp. D431a TaxID=2837388 RepID=UPI0025555DDB|nr:hypothetical protein [Vibrio sp. D431a]MDK9789913.1 hypothetical protein [Vibrio sp. D431a]